MGPAILSHGRLSLASSRRGALLVTKVLALGSVALLTTRPTACSATSADPNTCAALAMSTLSSVPESMTMRPSLRDADLRASPLVPLAFDADGVTVTEAAAGSSVALGDVLSETSGEHGSVCFVVRRPG